MRPSPSPTTGGPTLAWDDGGGHGVALRLHSVVALDGTGQTGAEVMSTIENPGNVVAADHLADGSIIFLECCKKDTATLAVEPRSEVGNAGARVRCFHRSGEDCRARHNTGTVSIYDTLTKTTATIDTPLVKHAPWIGISGESIAWSRDDQHLALTFAGELWLVDAIDGSVLTEATPAKKHALVSPAVLADGRVIAIDSFLGSSLVAIDSRTGTQRELASLNTKPERRHENRVARIAPLPDGQHVLFIAGDGRLYRVDINTKAIEDLHSKSNYEWIAP